MSHKLFVHIDSHNEILFINVIFRYALLTSRYKEESLTESA
jgi:hypothetical protein